MDNAFITKVTDNDNCCSLPQPVLNQKQAEEYADIFAALADVTRVAIVNLLANNREEVCVCDITASFKVGQPTISHHLRILKEAGLVVGVKRGKWVHYSLVAGIAEKIGAQLEILFNNPFYK